MANVGNIQRLIVEPVGPRYAALSLFHIESGVDAVSFIKEIFPSIYSGFAPPGDQPETSLGLLLSWSALEKLMAGRSALSLTAGKNELGRFFTDPTERPDSPGLARSLGFAGPSAPEHWWGGAFKSSAIEIAILSGHTSLEARSKAIEYLRSLATRSGLSPLEIPHIGGGLLQGERPADGILHFGYRDGISRLDIDWSDTGTSQGSIDKREFILGYPNDKYPTMPTQPGPWQDFAREGCFTALTWIYQDVATFNGWLAREAVRLQGAGGIDQPEEWLAAQLMGRWRRGAPLIKASATEPVGLDLDNDFGYIGDPSGRACPLSAHIRVVNPRDQPLTDANKSRFPGGTPRLIRRGFSYGPRLNGLVDDGMDRGIVGVFAGARINEQLYTILRWMQKTDFSEAFAQAQGGFRLQDSLMGTRSMDGANSRVIFRSPTNARFQVTLQQFIRFKGVAVMLAPSLSAIRHIAGEQ